MSELHVYLDDRGQKHFQLVFNGSAYEVQPTDSSLAEELAPGIYGDVAQERRTKEWNEDDHPRDEDGKFTFGGGGDDESSGDAGAGSSAIERWTLKAGGPHGEKWSKVANDARDKVLKENPRFKAASLEVTHTLNKAMAEADNFKEWRDWYDRHKPLARDLFGKKEPVFETFLAACSIDTMPAKAVPDAVAGMLHYLRGGKFDTKKDFPRGVLPVVREQLVHIENKEPISGKKTVPFERALQGDWSQVVTDRHMVRLLFDKDEATTNVNKGQVAVAQAVITAMANKLGWKPAELQAVLWVVSLHHQNLKAIDFRQFLEKQADDIRANLKKRALDDDNELDLSPYQLLLAYENAATLIAAFEAIQEAAAQDQGDDEEQKQVRDWDESEHPRDEDGKFADAGGGDESSGNEGGGSGGRAPRDKDGNKLVDLDDKPVELDHRGNLVLFHRTTEAAAKKIVESGKFKSKENTGEAYFSNRPAAQAAGYGEFLVTVTVKPNKVRLNDAFHKGEVYVAVKTSDIKRSNIVGCVNADGVINENGEFVLFHGTSDAAVADIKKEGLKPRAGEGADKWAKTHGMPIGNKFNAGERKLSVYLCPSVELASPFARVAAEVRHSKPAILEIDFPADQIGHIRPDEQGEPGMLRFIGTIKPEWIGKRLDVKGNLGVHVEDTGTGDVGAFGPTRLLNENAMKLIAVIFDEDEESTEQDMAKQFTFRERDKVNRRARKALGLKVRDAQDKADFMEQCIPQMMTDGEAGDASEAEIICELLWEEGESDLYD